MTDTRPPPPAFRYHPDPVATGMAEESDSICEVCNRTAHWLYVGPIYSAHPEADEPAVCLYCIESGRAAKAYADPQDLASLAHFNICEDYVSPGHTARSNIPEQIVHTVRHQTPGINAWQDWAWPTCCEDVCAYYGGIGYEQLAASPKYASLLARLQAGPYAELIPYLTAKDQPAGYLFTCLHCGISQVPIDFT